MSRACNILVRLGKIVRLPRIVSRAKIFFVTQGKTKKTRNDKIKKDNVAIDRARKADPQD
jgi:hypothetical protein